jgi:predicted metal-dependent peptidase
MSKYTPEEKLSIARIALQRKHPFYAYLTLKLKTIEKEDVGTAGVDGKGKMYYSPSFIASLSTDELVFLWAHEVGHLIFEHLALKGKRNHVLWNMAGDYAINLILVRDGVGKFIDGGLLEEKYAGWTASQIYDDLMKDAEKNMAKYAQCSGNDNHDAWGDLSEEEQQRVSKEWQQNAVSAAHACKAAGKEVPEAFRGLIDDLVTPKICWRDIVREKIITHNKEDQSWSRINRRRSLGEGFNYPGKKPGEKVSFMVAIDVSGSFTQDMVTDAMSEIYGATKEFQEVDVEVIQWDTRTYGHTTFTQDDGEKMMEYKIQGGGGTDFNCVHKWMRDNQKEPVQLFVFTDLYFTYMEDPLICPTTFIVIGNDAAPPYGDSINYN